MIIGISGKIGSGKDTVGKIIQYLTTKPNDAKNLVDYFDNEWNAERSNWKIKKFAGKLKQCISIITGIPVADLEKEEVKNSNLPECWNIITEYPNITMGEIREAHTITVRKLLQLFGTEVGRQIHPNFWVNALFVDYTEDYKYRYGTLDVEAGEFNELYRGGIHYPNWIITDVRFPNELKAIKDRDGISIRVERCNSTPQDDHIFVNKSTRTHPSETALDDATFDYTIDNSGTIDELIIKVKEILIKEKLL